MPDLTPPPPPPPVPAAATGKKKSVWEIILRAIAIAIGAWAGGTLYNHSFSHPATVEETLAATCAQANKNMPLKVDNETRLDSESTGPGRIFRYNYTLINSSGDQLDWSQVQARLKQHILDNYRTNADLKYFRDNGVSLVYDYSDAKGKHVMEIEVGPDDLK